MAVYTGQINSPSASSDPFRIKVQVDLLTQESGNNRSLIQYSAWIEKVVSGTAAFNNNTTFGHTNIDGYNPGRSLSSYSFGSGGADVGKRYYLAQNEQYWINHNSDGTKTGTFGADYDGDNGFLDTGSVSGNFVFPTINRFATITSYTQTNITDTSFTVNVSTNVTCDVLQYSLNGGGYVTVGSGTFTSRSFTISDLLSDINYTIKVRVRRQDSGLYTESSTVGITTLVQNKFFDLVEF